LLERTQIIAEREAHDTHALSAAGRQRGWLLARALAHGFGEGRAGGRVEADEGLRRQCGGESRPQLVVKLHQHEYGGALALLAQGAGRDGTGAGAARQDGRSTDTRHTGEHHSRTLCREPHQGRFAARASRGTP
jgi:hypothetical protein